METPQASTPQEEVLRICERIRVLKDSCGPEDFMGYSDFLLLAIKKYRNKGPPSPDLDWSLFIHQKEGDGGDEPARSPGAVVNPADLCIAGSLFLPAANVSKATDNEYASPLETDNQTDLGLSDMSPRGTPTDTDVPGRPVNKTASHEQTINIDQWASERFNMETSSTPTDTEEPSSGPRDPRHARTTQLEALDVQGRSLLGRISEEPSSSGEPPQTVSDEPITSSEEADEETNSASGQAQSISNQPSPSSEDADEGANSASGQAQSISNQPSPSSEDADEEPNSASGQAQSISNRTSPSSEDADEGANSTAEQARAQDQEIPSDLSEKPTTSEGLTGSESQHPRRLDGDTATDITTLIQSAIAEFSPEVTFPADGSPTTVRGAEEIDKFFSRFAPGSMLSSSHVNSILSSFQWGPDVSVMHSSKLEITPNKEWHKVAHWTLFDINLRECIVWHYNSSQEGRVTPVLEKACREGLRDFCRENMKEGSLKFEEGISAQQTNNIDCGVYTVRNAELLSNERLHESSEEEPADLRFRYLRRTIDFARWSRWSQKFHSLVARNPIPLKRRHPSDLTSSASDKKRRLEREASSPQGCPEVREALVEGIGDPSADKAATRGRAEHLLKMIEAIACEEVLDSWEHSIPPPSRSTRRMTSSDGSSVRIARSIYNLVSRSQSRSFKETVVLRIAKYLFTSRIVDRVGQLRDQGPPSKQRVATAGTTGEGNAVTRAIKEFLGEVHPKDIVDHEIEACEIRKCKQWWKDGKIWKLLADAVHPAILLLVPSGHKTTDDSRIWDSESLLD
ncbi:MAG: hypothetical protein Q9168_001728 [Polycauliona sp. 1 TL-2023]